MLRHEWEFEFSAQQLIDASNKKIAHHRKRLEFWTDAKGRIMTEIKDSGLEVSESSAETAYISNKMLGPQVMVRGDLQRRLTEAFSKMKEHDQQVKDYSAWVQFFMSRPGTTLKLHSEDYLFFFGE